MDVLDMKNIDAGKIRYKTVSAETGRASFEYVRKVIELAMAGKIDATVTGPINKEAINRAGFHYSGHTEIYADLTKTRDYAMLLAHENFRVIHVSTHVSLREACDRVKKERVYRVIRLGEDAVKKLGIDRPRIAVAGLNPHAGENGMFGREEIEEIEPAIMQARSEGLNVEGPIPADTVFSKMQGGQYDLVVAMYHDEGHIPTKVIGFQYDERHQNVGFDVRNQHHLRPAHHPGLRRSRHGVRQGGRRTGESGEHDRGHPDCGAPGVAPAVLRGFHVGTRSPQGIQKHRYGRLFKNVQMPRLQQGGAHDPYLQ